MNKMINFMKKIIKVTAILVIITLWFMGMCYTIQNTIFNH